VASVRGSCLCGGVQFTVELPFIVSNHCHCTTCQKSSGTGHTTSARATPRQISFQQGKDLLRSFQPAPGQGNKTFCSVCGSNLFGGQWPDGEYVSVRLSALDDDPQLRPSRRTFVAFNGPWFEIPDDDLPRFEEKAG
jgi:hypothetical protein